MNLAENPLKLLEPKTVNFGQPLFEMTEDIDTSLAQKLQPIYSSLYNHSSQAKCKTLQQMSIAKKALELAKTIFHEYRQKHPNKLPKSDL